MKISSIPRLLPFPNALLKRMKNIAEPVCRTHDPNSNVKPVGLYQ